jgi:predicted RNase H-like HicB family nuclease
MSFVLIAVIALFSAALATFFILRDAKNFAHEPPTPVIDLDRMYDVIFSRLDEATAQGLTPQDLETVLQGFVATLSEHDLIKENLAEPLAETSADPLSVEIIASNIVHRFPELDVEKPAIENVVELSFAYLEEIKALA